MPAPKASCQAYGCKRTQSRVAHTAARHAHDALTHEHTSTPAPTHKHTPMPVICSPTSLSFTGSSKLQTPHWLCRERHTRISFESIAHSCCSAVVRPVRGQPEASLHGMSHCDPMCLEPTPTLSQSMSRKTHSHLSLS